jgi:iron(III) transport system permease protein
VTSLRREPSLLFALLAVTGLVLAFIVYPQLRVISEPGGSGYIDFFAGQTWVRPLQNSLTVTALSTTTAVLLGFIYAYAMVYTDMRGKPFFRLVGILPLLSPPFVVAAAYILLFGPRGIITYNIFGQSPNILGLYGIWGVQTIAFFPFAYQLIADVLSRSDARLEQAARNLGAGPWQVFKSVTLPLTRPGLGAAILTTAIYVLEDFGNPALIGGLYVVLPTQAYGLISGFGELDAAAAVSTILLGLALILYLGKLRLDGGQQYVTVSGKASSMPRPPVPRVVSWGAFVACSLCALIILLVFGVLFVSAITLHFPTNLTPTIEHFEYVGAHNLSLRNTLTYGVVAAVFSSVFALFAAFLVERGKWRGRRILDFLLIMPAAVPGLFFGLGYVTAFNGTWLDDLDETGGVIITLALIFWNIPVGYQAAVAGLRQIDRTIDEAATSLGAGGLRMFRDVLVPMLGGSLRVGFTTTFVRAVTTLSLIIFLFTTQSVTATITIFQLVGDFNWGGATAFTVADIGMAVIALLVIAILSRGRVSLGGARG